MKKELMYLEHGELSWERESAGSAEIVTAPASPKSGPFPPPSGPDLPRIELQGVWFHAITEQGCIEHILRELSAGRGGVVVTPNVDHLRRRGRDLSFLALVAEANLVVADGMPLVWASRLQGTPLPQRVAGSDLISSLSAAAASQGRSVFLLGGDPGTAEGASTILRDRYPQLRVAGTFCPPLGFEKDETELARVAEALKKAQPDIVYVALGSPKQERLIDRLRRVLPGAWWLGVGVSFSFLCGEVRRAPLWMRKWGLEWIHRLLQEPRRLFKRYIVVGLPYATFMLMLAALKGVPTRLLRRVSGGGGSAGSPSAPRPVRQSDPSNEGANGDGHPKKPLGVAQGVRPATMASGRLRGLVLLGGSVRPSPLAAAIDRSVLDLPIGEGGTVLTRWLDQATDVARRLRIDRLPVRLLLDSNAVEPRSASRERFSVERDASEYRGTGGLLATIAVDYEDDDLILVGNAAQLLLDPLTAMFKALRRTGGVVSMASHRDGTPSGMMLVTCRSLRLIPPVGFVDMKEQALPIIADRFDVRVLQCRRPTGLPLRSLSDYVAALRAFHAPLGRPMAADPLAEEWKSMFAIVEPGAAVAPSARLYDSVVLAGGSVEGGAVVVRSLVTTSGVVRKDRKAVDQYVTAEAARRSGRILGRTPAMQGS